MIIKKLPFLLVAFAFFTTLAIGAESTPYAIRAAVDIGSGATKLRVVEVDTKTQKIVNVLKSESYAVPYQEYLAKAKDNNFNPEIKKLGIEALKKAAEVAKEYKAEKIIGVATAAFRNAGNTKEFVDEIYKETGVEVFVIDQAKEGELAFEAVRADFGIDPTRLVVWDIGGGSLQLTTVDENGQYHIYRGHDASIPFKNHVIANIQKRDIEAHNTPNPLNGSQLFRAQFDAIELAEKVDHVFKEKIKQKDVKVVGVGNIFGYQITKMVGGNLLKKEHLVPAVSELVNKTDADVGGGDFANVYVTNSVLVLGLMEGLEIKKMALADINPADGAFVHPTFWD